MPGQNIIPERPTNINRFMGKPFYFIAHNLNAFRSITIIHSHAKYHLIYIDMNIKVVNNILR